MKVRKRDGNVVDFDASKVINSLRLSGVSEVTIDKILSKIKEKNFPIISTDKLYGFIYDLVKKYENKYNASIYSLKNAIMRLGPDGYNFEDFIAKIFRLLNYDVKVRKIYPSLCVTHELDVVGKDFFIECKYHNSGGISTGIKEVMYSHARFLDLQNANKKKGYSFKELWVASNTKFSDDAIKYSEYWKLNLIGWKQGKMSLSDIIDKNAWYPVTLLPCVSKRVFDILNKNSILLINEVIDKDDNYLRSMGLNNSEICSLRYDCNNLTLASKRIHKEAV